MLVEYYITNDINELKYNWCCKGGHSQAPGFFICLTIIGLSVLKNTHCHAVYLRSYKWYTDVPGPVFAIE